MYFVDIQGTLIDDVSRQPIDGALEFVASLKKNKIPFVLITNNTKYKSSEFMAYLRGLGFVFDDSEYLDPFSALKHVVKDESVWGIGNDGFVEALRSEGYSFDKQKPQNLVVSLKEGLAYDDLADAVEYIQGGAKLIGMHETAIYAKNGRKYPGLGAIIRALEYATNTKAKIVGKPSDEFYAEAMNMLGGRSFSDITIISDDAIGDLVGAKKLGMKTILVLSGKYKSEDEIVPFLAQGESPCETLGSIAELVCRVKTSKVDRCIR